MPSKNFTAPAIADLNKDGYPDLVLGHACQLDVFLGGADGTLSFFASVSNFSESREQHGRCAVVPTIWDWDGDGILDVIVGDYFGKLYLCYLSDILTCDTEPFDACWW